MGSTCKCRLLAEAIARGIEAHMQGSGGRSQDVTPPPKSSFFCTITPRRGCKCLFHRTNSHAENARLQRLGQNSRSSSVYHAYCTSLISGIVYAMRIFMSLIVLCFTLALTDMNNITMLLGLNHKLVDGSIVTDLTTCKMTSLS